MGIQNQDNFSASVEAFLVVGDRRIKVAKTGPDEIVLSQVCELPPRTEGNLVTIVDGHVKSRLIVLQDGADSGQTQVRYSSAAPY